MTTERSSDHINEIERLGSLSPQEVFAEVSKEAVDLIDTAVIAEVLERLLQPGAALGIETDEAELFQLTISTRQNATYRIFEILDEWLMPFEKEELAGLLLRKRRQGRPKDYAKLDARMRHESEVRRMATVLKISQDDALDRFAAENGWTTDETETMRNFMKRSARKK